MKAFLYTVLTAVAVLSVALVVRASTSPAERAASRPSTFSGYVFNDDGDLIGPVNVPTDRRPEAERRRGLTGEQYHIVRGAGTERPFTGALLKNKDAGVYTCVACGLPLFKSDTKFESGTGWPSFFDEIGPGNVIEHPDRSLGMVRTEINCARCDGHLGHVFPDGPQPTGLRYCVNSESIGFTRMDDIKTLADPAAKMNETTTKNTTNMADGPRATAVFAGGCFWCVEAVFEELDGVHEAISGYAGGSAADANYKAVCSGKTKHAEAVQIVYDPAKIAFEDLLRVHFATHDPTQLNRQGNDYGPQYRSAIFVANDEEKALAQAFIADLGGQGLFKKKVVTTLEPLTEFFPAETYHQNYVCQNPNAGYVRGVALPKVEKVRKQFKDKLKETSPLEGAR